jgi:hypothetical protein
LLSFFEKGIVGLPQKLASLRSDSQFAAEKDVVRLRILLSLSLSLSLRRRRRRCTSLVVLLLFIG